MKNYLTSTETNKMENYLTSTETTKMENYLRSIQIKKTYLKSTETKEDTKIGRPVCHTSVCCLEFVLYSHMLYLFCWGV